MVTMDKEQTLEALKDLVAVLRSPNFKEPLVRERWQEKHFHVQASLEKLSAKDLEWISKRYREWHKDNVAPHIDGNMARLARRENFPWI